ncbi:MAG: hypothetical protein K9N48_08260 [Verrucomicrobia bacterium]|nr:hypothetical protein [Verrucomicrobiota bacterium]MCF7708759.1 hypothetical protein [Verrucomicrobiota bacterium]
MRTWFFIVSCVLIFPGIPARLHAQTETTGSIIGDPTPDAAAATNSATGTTQKQKVIEITSRRFELDSQKGIAEYIGHVKVDDPQMQISCDVLSVLLSTNGTLRTITAEATNGVVDIVLLQKQQGGTVRKTHAEAQKAVYSTETELVELTGNPVVRNNMGTLWGDVITVDRVMGKMNATNPRMELNPDTLGEAGSIVPANSGNERNTPTP